MKTMDTLRLDKQFATFFVNGLYVGVELCCVQELIRFQEMTHVPLAPPHIRGLINLRGQIVIAVDARRALSLPERPADQEPMNVVLRSGDGCTSLLVDSIGDVVSVEDCKRGNPPANIPPALRQKIVSVFQLPHALLLIPDLSLLIG